MLPAASRPASAARFRIRRVVRPGPNRLAFPVDNWMNNCAAACLANPADRPSAANWPRLWICAAAIPIRRAPGSMPCSFSTNWSDLLPHPGHVKVQPCRQVLHKQGLIHRFRIGVTIVVGDSTARIRDHAPVVAKAKLLNQKAKKCLSTGTVCPLLLLLLIYIRFFKRQGTSSP